MVILGWRFKADPSVPWTVNQLLLLPEMANHPINMTNSPPQQTMYSVRMAVGHPELPVENRVQLQRETAQYLKPGWNLYGYRYAPDDMSKVLSVTVMGNSNAPLSLFDMIKILEGSDRGFMYAVMTLSGKLETLTVTKQRGKQ